MSIRARCDGRGGWIGRVHGERELHVCVGSACEQTGSWASRAGGESRTRYSLGGNPTWWPPSQPSRLRTDSAVTAGQAGQYSHMRHIYLSWSVADPNQREALHRSAEVSHK
jgi:hypothetical protein